MDNAGKKIARAALRAAFLASLTISAIIAIASISPALGEGIAQEGKNFARGSQATSAAGKESAGRAPADASGARVAKAKKAAAPGDARTVGIGKSCQKSADCLGRTQICLKESDANGKELPRGMCALPCAAIDDGLPTPAAGDPGPSEEELKKPPPPRCPKKFQCRSAGSGVPIDLCVKE